MEDINTFVSRLLSKANDLSFTHDINQVTIDFGEEVVEQLNNLQYSLIDEKTKIKSFSSEFGSIAYKIGNVKDVIDKSFERDIQVLNDLENICNEVQEKVKSL